MQMVGDCFIRENACGFSLVVILAFLRISTNPCIFDRPLDIDSAIAYVDEWFAVPCVQAVSPRHGHWDIFQRLIVQSGTGGNLTTDAFLAAIAIEQGYTLYSTDNNFKRFADLVDINLLLV